MRIRETHINIRTTPKEKLRFERNAKKCGLSLSEYMRKLANGYAPQALPPPEYQKIRALLSDIYLDWRESGDKRLAGLLLHEIQRMQENINPRKRGENDGGNENMADS